MTPDNWLTLLGIVISIVISWSISAQARQSVELKNAEWRGKMETKVNAMWGLLFRKASLEGLETGLLRSDSPIHINIEAFTNHPQFVKKLREFYAASGNKLSDLDLLVEIENRFSSELTALELEHHLKNGASLAAACFLVRPEMTLFNHQPIDEWKKKIKGMDNG